MLKPFATYFANPESNLKNGYRVNQMIVVDQSTKLIAEALYQWLVETSILLKHFPHCLNSNKPASASGVGQISTRSHPPRRAGQISTQSHPPRRAGPQLVPLVQSVVEGPPQAIRGGQCSQEHATWRGSKELLHLALDDPVYRTVPFETTGVSS